MRFLAMRVLVIFLLSAAIQGARAAARESATVRVHAVDRYGKGLGPVTVIGFAQPRVGGADYTSRFVGDKAKGIPFGEYNVSVRAGGVIAGGRVDVESTETFIVLSGSAVYMDYAPGNTPVQPGRVTGLPENTSRPIWVRVFDLYREDVKYREALRIGDDGSFTGLWLEEGEYVITVLNDTGVLYNGLLRLDNPRSEIEINVGAGVVTTHPMAFRPSKPK